ncbi:MAG: hypothetical protein N2314_02340 [Brevinematales bacterium]|nr:hypothetical protein [Brevinematales bacterium]
MPADIPMLWVGAHPIEFPPSVRKRITKIPALVQDKGMVWGMTGVGKRNVLRFYRLLDEQHMRVKHVVVMGFAGSIDKRFSPGEIVAIGAVIDCAGKKGFLGEYQKKQSSVVGLEVSHWTQKEEKKYLKEEFPEVSVIDMETATHVEECKKRGIEVSVYRIISDGCEEKLPPLSYIGEDFTKLPWKRLCEHPLHFLWGMFFSMRLWGYRKKLIQWLHRWRIKAYDILENT